MTILIPVIFLLLLAQELVLGQQSADPSTLNGGSLLAMAGRDAVALAVDRRFARESALVNVLSKKVLIPSSMLMVACCGLEGDVHSLQQTLQAQVGQSYQQGLGLTGSLYDDIIDRRRREVISPTAMASLTSHVLYNRRQAPYYVEPVVVGLELDDESKNGSSDHTSTVRPYLCSLDMIGATSLSREFVCAGAASKSLYGAAEDAFVPDMEADQLLEVCGRAFISALERDCLSGYGATVYLITKNGIDEYELAGRND